jgi:dTDP-4-amino-4,6-dideoxygalactose transaminase
MAALVDTVPIVPLRQTCRENDLVFGSPSVEEADIAAVVEALRSGSIGTGPRTAEAGFKYNLTDLQASPGLRQLTQIEQMNRR